LCWLLNRCQQEILKEADENMEGMDMSLRNCPGLAVVVLFGWFGVGRFVACCG
jgi:hypothetical protein